MKTKTRIKKKAKTKTKTKTKMKIKMNFRFSFHFVFHFCFCFCFLKVFAFLLTLRGLAVPQTVNCLFIGLEVPLRLCKLHGAQRCHRRSTLSYLVQKCHSTQKYGTQPNLHMQHSVMLFIFFVFDWKYPFWANLVQKTKIICLS